MSLFNAVTLIGRRILQHRNVIQQNKMGATDSMQEIKKQCRRIEANDKVPDSGTQKPDYRTLHQSPLGLDTGVQLLETNYRP